MMEANEIMIKKMQNMMDNPDFIDKLHSAKTIEDGISLLKEHGITVTEKELTIGYKKGMAFLEEKGYIENGELTEAAMESVAGGSRWGYGVAKLGAGAAGAGLGLMLAGVCLTPAAGLIIVGSAVAIGCFNL